MNSPILHVAIPAVDFSDTSPPDGIVPGEDSPRVSKILPPRFATFKDQTFERSIATDKDQVLDIVSKQVRISKAPIVYVYELVAAVCYEPMAVVIEPDQIAERLKLSE